MDGLQSLDFFQPRAKLKAFQVSSKRFIGPGGVAQAENSGLAECHTLKNRIECLVSLSKTLLYVVVVFFFLMGNGLKSGSKGILYVGVATFVSISAVRRMCCRIFGPCWIPMAAAASPRTRCSSWRRIPPRGPPSYASARGVEWSGDPQRRTAWSSRPYE